MFIQPYRMLRALAVLVALTSFAPLARAAIKLYLKDGSYQLVKSYEIKGNRVRYYSLERSEWEEIPAALVDFDATKRAEENERQQQQKQVQEVQELEKQRFEPPAVSGFEVAPGIHLPPEPGVYAFDGSRVLPLVQSSAEVVTDKRRVALTLALPAPVVKNRSLVVLAGPTAAVRLRVTRPTFFVRLPDSSGDNFQLLAVKPGKETRVVEKVQGGLGVGKSGELRSSLPLERAEVAPGIFSLRPAQPLAPGEYALGEKVQAQNRHGTVEEKLSLDMWDFGIDKQTGK